MDRFRLRVKLLRSNYSPDARDRAVGILVGAFGSMENAIVFCQQHEIVFVKVAS